MIIDRSGRRKGTVGPDAIEEGLSGDGLVGGFRKEGKDAKFLASEAECLAVFSASLGREIDGD